MTRRAKLALGLLSGAVLSAAAYSPSFNLASSAEGATPPAQTPAPTAEPTCTMQYAARPDVSAAGLLTQNFQIRAAVPGGLWLQKEKDVFYCNAGIVVDGDTLCWKLTAPVRGQACTNAAQKAAAKPVAN